MKILISLCTLSLFGLAVASSWNETEQDLNTLLESTVLWQKQLGDLFDYYENVYNYDNIKKQNESGALNILQYEKEVGKKPECNKKFVDALYRQGILITDLADCAKNVVNIAEKLFAEAHYAIINLENEIIDLRNMKCGNLQTRSTALNCNIEVREQLMLLKSFKYINELRPVFLNIKKLTKMLKKPGNCFDKFETKSARFKNELKSCIEN